MNKILVDKKGYKQFYDELEKIKQLSLTTSCASTESYNDAIGDGWHDNFDFEDSVRISRTIARKIDKMKQEESMLEIIDYINLGDDHINLEDSFEVEIKYDEDDIEIENLKLTGQYIPNTNLPIKEISMNSPIGKAVYHKKIGETVTYDVGNNLIELKIVKKNAR